ncbi:MAG: FeoB small GTPase domain-containing protein, partial [Candidatus Bathyarchaeia archaeon]
MAESEATIALAGNANVGKSAIFNQLTGASQTIGNWPGKTVEKAEGTLFFMGRVLKVIDLPGIYSLSTFSMEEIIAREYIATGRPDVIVNVVDASSLERNLYFTLQLLEMEAPLIIALNQVDYASKKGIRIDAKRLSELLGVPVVPTVAITGEGIEELLRTIVDYL